MSHHHWMSTILNDTVDDPDLELVIKTVPHAAVSDFVSTDAGHISAFFVAAIRTTEATLLSDERCLAASRAKIAGGGYFMKFSVARYRILYGPQA